MNRKNTYQKLDQVLDTVVVLTQRNENYETDLSSLFPEIDIVQYLNKLKEDGYIYYYPSNSNFIVRLEGRIFLSQGGYERLYCTEKWEKVQKWIKFCLLIISGLGVILTICFSYINYSMTKEGYDESIQKIEKRLDSLIRK